MSAVRLDERAPATQRFSEKSHGALIQLEGELVSAVVPAPIQPLPLDAPIVTGGPAPVAPHAGDPFDKLIDAWVRVAVRHARVRRVDDLFVADVVGIPGAWSQGDTADEALEELPDVIEGWVRLKLDDGDTDIPPMEGIHLVVEE